jgi:hypothetical protein
MPPRRKSIADLGAISAHGNGWRARLQLDGKKLDGPQRSTRAEAQEDLDRARQCNSRSEMAKYILSLGKRAHDSISEASCAAEAAETEGGGDADEEARAMDEIVPNFQQPVLMPDIVRFWQHGVRLLGCHVFLKSVRQEFVTATADGDKYFECSTAKNIFKKMDAGDLLLLVQTRSQQRVVAVGEVAHPALSREVNRAMLYDRLPHRLHDSLNMYLDGADAFDYVQFNKVYDLRDFNLKAKDLLEYGGFSMDPRMNFGMGVLEALETTESSIDKLRDFLETTIVRWPTSRVDSVDVY